MGWDNVPWFVGGGAQHSPEVARTLAYAAMGGSEGVIGGSDLKVLPYDVPGGGVQIVPGATGILNRSTGGSQQEYVGRLPTADTVAIAATGSSGGRSDMIVARVEDPFMAGEAWQAPADPTVGPYIFTRVLSNVGSTARDPHAIAAYSGQSLIPLARIDIPASTQTITAAMITDLRKIARPRRERNIKQVQVPAGNADLTSAAYVPFPAAFASFDVPAWATIANIRSTLVGPRLVNGAAAGRLLAQLGSGASMIRTGSTSYNEQTPSDTRRVMPVEDTVAIPAALRGTTQPLQMQATRAGGTGALRIDGECQVFMDVEFVEGIV